jgi:hypothetical protein
MLPIPCGCLSWMIEDDPWSRSAPSAGRGEGRPVVPLEWFGLSRRFSTISPTLGCHRSLISLPDWTQFL